MPGFSERWIEIQLKDIAEKGAADRNQRHKEIAEKTYRKLDANYGILSLSETPSETRMWGHYAGGGRGFVIELDAKHAWFHAMRNSDDGYNELTKAEYVARRPPKNLLEIKDEVLYTKSESWRYEQEWRIVRSFNDAKRKLGRLDTYGKEILLFAVPPDVIKGVIIGFSAESELEIAIRSALAQNSDLRHSEIRRAAQSAETGQVNIVSMKGVIA